MMKKLLNYLENHPYQKAISQILGIIGIVLMILFGIPSWISILKPDNNDMNQRTNLTSSTVENDKFLYESIFALVADISAQNTTLEKENLIKSKLGLIAQDIGLVVDIAKQSNDIQEGDYIIIKLVDTKHNQNNFKKAPIIFCAFSLDLEKSLNSIKQFDKINFSGQIIGGKNYDGLFANQYNDFLALRNCTLVR